MKLKTATLIAIAGLVLNLLYVIGNWMFMARGRLYGVSLQWQWLVSPILFHGSLLVFLVVLYRKQVDHNTSPETVTPAVKPDKPLPVATTVTPEVTPDKPPSVVTTVTPAVKPDKPPSVATAIQPGLIAYTVSLTSFVLGAVVLVANDWTALGENYIVLSLAVAAVVLWVVSLVFGLIAARYRTVVWWWTGPLVAIALAAIIGLPARYFWLEQQKKANQANAPTAVPVSPVEPAPAPTVEPVAPIPPVETTPAATAQYDPKHINDVNELRKKYKPKILQSGLVAYYPFNGKATDESGNNNNGTVFGATLVADRHGIGNSAYRFDGNSGYIDCGNAQSLKIAGKGMTISVWININGNGRNWGRIVLGGAVNTSYTLCKSDPEDRILWRLTGIGEITSSVLDRNKWHHVVASYNGVKMSIYIDGNLNVSSNAQGNIYTNSKSIVIGGEDENHGGMSSCFDGVIDDVIIYNRALPPEEISLLYKEY